MTPPHCAAIPLAVSGSGHLCSIASLDGTVRVWDTVTCEVTGQYTPTAHLSSPVVCMCWPPARKLAQSDSSAKRTRRSKVKLDAEEEIVRLGLVAMGTQDGHILLFSAARDALHCRLEGHSGRVNCLSWSAGHDSLFSCSQDRHVIEWSVSESSVRSKSKLQDCVYTSVCALDENNLLLAASSIQWWHWGRKQLLQTFSGHSGAVTCLRPLLFEALGEEGDQHCYFLSSAHSERHLNAWQLSTCKPASVATFALDEEPVSLETTYTSPSRRLLLLAVSRSGTLFVFEHQFGASAGLVSARMKLRINTVPRHCLTNGQGKSGGSTSRPVPLLLAQPSRQSLANGLNGATGESHPLCFLLGYGSPDKPCFERVTYAECERSYLHDGGILRRHETGLADHSQLSVVNVASHSKIRSRPPPADRVTELGPAALVPTQPLFNNIHDPANGLNGDSLLSDDELGCGNGGRGQVAEMTLDEQLRRVEGEEASVSASKRLKRSDRKCARKSTTDSMVSVLVQGLQSNDTHMLATVLTSTEPELMCSTVKRLGVEYVPSLLRQLQRHLLVRSEHQLTYLRWITVLIQHKISFLITMPNIQREFLSLNQLLSARTSLLDRCYQLKGRLDMMLSQVRQDQRTERLSRTEARMSYESSSSSEEEDNWEDHMDLEDKLGEEVSDEDDPYESAIEDSDEAQSSDLGPIDSA